MKEKKRRIKCYLVLFGFINFPSYFEELFHTSMPNVPSPSAQPAAEEELEEVSGRRLLQGPPEEEVAPLPRVLVRVRRSIEEATSSAEAAFRREWATLESERQRLFDWHTSLEAHTKAEASHAMHARSKLKADQEAYRANLRKV